jgi:hypothetical protein
VDPLLFSNQEGHGLTMNGSTVWLLISVNSLREIAESPIITIGRALTVAKGYVLLEIEFDLSKRLSNVEELKNGPGYYQPKLPGM